MAARGMSVRTKAITWEQGRHSCCGSVGKLSLFSYGWHGGDDPARKWYVATALPQIARAYCESEEACRAKAERMLASFVNALAEV